MSIKMIDAEIAEKVTAAIGIGEYIRIEVQPGMISELPVLNKTLYSVTVQGATNRITCPVQFTELYRKEMEMRTPADNLPTGKRPGRPPGSRNKPAGPQAPAEHPQQADARPVPAAGAIPSWAAPQAAPAPQATPADSGADNSDTLMWAMKECDVVLADFRATYESLLKQVVATIPDAPEPPEPEPVPLTCGDCEHSNLATGLCEKFNAFPPINIVLNAPAKCHEFRDSQAALAAEIPY